MPDITRPENVTAVQPRLEGKDQGGGRDTRGQPSKKAAASYQEVARSKPLDDRITILGIPVEQITPVTQAALAGLVAEINHLRNVVNRHERSSDKRGGQAQQALQQTDTAVLEYEAFARSLGAMLAQPAGTGQTWAIVLVHVSTYEDIRRSSGLLAANSALADVAYRLREVRLSISPVQSSPPVGLASDTAPSGAAPSVAALDGGASGPFALLGYVGGSNFAAVTALPQEGLDTGSIGRSVRDQLSVSGYVVGGIDMALAIAVSASAVGLGESSLLALGRADHLLRTQ